MHNTDASLNLSILTHFFNYKSDYQFERAGSLSNIRIIHIATHLNNSSTFLKASLTRPDHCAVFMHDLMSVFYLYSLDPKWVNSRHPVIQLYLLCVKLYGFYANVSPLPPDLALWIHFILQNDCIDIAIKNNFRFYSFGDAMVIK